MNCWCWYFRKLLWIVKVIPEPLQSPWLLPPACPGIQLSAPCGSWFPASKVDVINVVMKQGCGSASLYCGSGSDPCFYFNENMDPDQSFANLRPLAYIRPSKVPILTLWAPEFNADPDPAFYFNADPDPASQNTADSCGAGSTQPWSGWPECANISQAGYSNKQVRVRILIRLWKSWLYL